MEQFTKLFIFFRFSLFFSELTLFNIKLLIKGVLQLDIVGTQISVQHVPVNQNDIHICKTTIRTIIGHGKRQWNKIFS